MFEEDAPNQRVERGSINGFGGRKLPRRPVRIAASVGAILTLCLNSDEDTVVDNCLDRLVRFNLLSHVAEETG